jgi:hypothetical protein
MTTKPLHNHGDTHLYDGSFKEYAADKLPSKADVLVASRSERHRSAIIDEIRSSDSLSCHVECYGGGQSDLPFKPDTFDAAIHCNPSRGTLQRHRPLYEMVAAVREQGIILYRAPNYIAQSDSASVEELQVIGWGSHGDPTIAARLEVTATGDPRNENQTGSNETTFSDFL